MNSVSKPCCTTIRKTRFLESKSWTLPKSAAVASMTVARSRDGGIEQPRIGTLVSQKQFRACVLDDTSRFENDHPPNTAQCGQPMGNHDEGAPGQSVLETRKQLLL